MKDDRVSEYYLDFKKKYNSYITDVPSIDDVVEVYLKNKKQVNFSDIENGGYTFLVDLERADNPPLGCWYDGYYYIDEEEINSKIPTDCIMKPSFDNSNFILFERNEKVPYFYEDQCKLWLNTKLENCYDIALELAEYIDKNHSTMSADGKEAKTCYKMSTCYNRNDTITIYTNYMEVDSIIEFLKNLKNNRPNLFETDRRNNPLIPKIDGFISYADINFSFSGPGLIAEIFQHISKYENEINSLPSEKQHDFVKSIILKNILARTEYNIYPCDCLLDTDNLCSVRLNDVPYNKITNEEAELQRTKLKNQLKNIEEKLAVQNEIEM